MMIGVICGVVKNTKKYISPIQYDDIEDMKENKEHYAIWVPDGKEGIPSPWGVGRPSVNLYVFGFFD